MRGRRLCALGLGLGAAGGLFMLALLLWGETPAQALAYGHISLKLEGSWKWAAVLAMLHGCRCMAVCGSVAAGFEGNMRPGRLGLAAAVWTAALTGLGNAALMRQPDTLMALKEPFAAMGSQWGKAGYFFAGGLLWTGAMAGLAGVLLSAGGLMRSDGKKGC